MKKAGERDVNKIIGLIKGQLKKLTAKDVGAIPITGGTIKGNRSQLIELWNTAGSAAYKLTPSDKIGGSILLQSNYRENGNQFLVIRVIEKAEGNDNLNLLVISEAIRQIYDYKTKTAKEIMVKGEAMPIGAVYTSINNTNPAAMLGGIWESMGTEEKAGTTCYLWKRTS